MIWFVFIFVSIVTHAIVGGETAICYGVQSEHLWCALSYQFIHSSWLHLFVNMLSICIMFNPICELWRLRYGTLYPFITIFVASYIGSVLSGVICAIDIPTVGASGIVFFLLGLLLMLNPTIKQLKNYLFVLIAVIVQLYFGNSNVALHIVSFVEGLLFVVMREFVKQYKSGECRKIYKDK